MDEIQVYDGLDSTDPYAALSAKQGNRLYGMIQALQNNIATDAEIDAIFSA